MLEKYKGFITIGKTSLDIKLGLTYDQWEELGQELKKIESGIQWWIGDWLNYGEVEYGERYTQALDFTDYTYGTLTNLKYAAKNIESSRRRENIDFSTHVEVASLTPDMQDKVLDEVEQRNLTKTQTREIVKAIKFPAIRETTLTRVILESPFAGGEAENIDFARACMADCLALDEAPFASHLLYTQKGVLNDHSKEERAQGIKAGFAWHKVADKMVVYTDLGISDGMKLGIENAKRLNLPIEYRTLNVVDK